MRKIKSAFFLFLIIFILFYLKFNLNNLDHFKYDKKLIIKSKINILSYVNYNLIYNSLSDMQEYIESSINSVYLKNKLKRTFFESQLTERLE